MTTGSILRLMISWRRWRNLECARVAPTMYPALQTTNPFYTENCKCGAYSRPLESVSNFKAHTSTINNSLTLTGGVIRNDMQVAEVRQDRNLRMTSIHYSAAQWQIDWSLFDFGHPHLIKHWLDVAWTMMSHCTSKISIFIKFSGVNVFGLLRGQKG